MYEKTLLNTIGYLKITTKLFKEYLFRNYSAGGFLIIIDKQFINVTVMTLRDPTVVDF